MWIEEVDGAVHFVDSDEIDAILSTQIEDGFALRFVFRQGNTVKMIVSETILNRLQKEFVC
jgi:hypothetical protein